MRLLWVLLVAAAVAAPIVYAENIEAQTVGAETADWREKAIELVEKAIERLEAVIERLPEDSKLLPFLNRKLEFLRKKLADLQDASVAFSEVNRPGLLQGLLDRLEEALEKLPEGPLRDRLQQAVDKIREVSLAAQVRIGSLINVLRRGRIGREVCTAASSARGPGSNPGGI